MTMHRTLDSESPASPARLHHRAASFVKPTNPAPVEAALSKAFGYSQHTMTLNPTREDRGSQVRAVPSSAPPAPSDIRVPETLKERLALARERLRHAAEQGQRIRVYEVALDLDMSEFHFARQFRAAYGCSPHVYYDEVRAARARDLLQQGISQGQAARRIGLRRPAELRALLEKRQSLQTIADIEADNSFAPAPASANG
jgi:AraC-like DNA-binding protein